MNLIEKIKKMISAMFSDKDLDIQSIDSEIYEQKQKITGALTQLYFQQGKLEDKKNQLEVEAERLTEDLNLAVKNGRDDLSLQILEKIDLIKEQVEFINSQLIQIASDVELAEQSRKEIDNNSLKVKTSYESFQTRKSLLESQKLIKEQLSSISLNGQTNFQDQLNEKLHSLNAQIKTLEGSSPLERDLSSLRKENLNNARAQRLEELKRKHFQSEVVLTK